MASEVDRWLSPQTAIAVLGIIVMAATVGGVFWVGDKSMISQTAGGVIGIGATIIAYYFNSSASSQRKDGTIGALTGADPAVSKTTIVSEPREPDHEIRQP